MGNVDFRSGTLRIAGQLFLPNASQYAPPYPAAVICHGMGSRKESRGAFAGWMAPHGFAALCFDFRGHGERGGQLDDRTLEDVLISYRWSEELFAHAREPKKLVWINNGHHRSAQQDERVHRTTPEWF
jgi:alpha-beta hydrolase superfamily lysophospholipase